MAGPSEPDLIREIHDMDDKERAGAFKRWVELSELVAPRRDDEATEPAGGEPPAPRQAGSGSEEAESPDAEEDETGPSRARRG